MGLVLALAGDKRARCSVWGDEEVQAGNPPTAGSVEKAGSPQMISICLGIDNLSDSDPITLFKPGLPFF